MIKSIQKNSQQFKNTNQNKSSIRLGKLNKKLNRIYFSPRDKQPISLRAPKLSPYPKQQFNKNEHGCLRAFVQSKIVKESPYQNKKQSIIKNKHRRFNTQFYLKDIIKLPSRYQQRKYQAQHKKVLNISRPCRIKINHTQIHNNSKNKNNLGQVNKSSDYLKIKKSKILKNKSFGTLQCSQVNEDEKLVVFPNSNVVNEFKSTKNTHTQKNNTPQPTKNKLFHNKLNSQENQKLLNFKQIQKIKKRNPLKIKTCFQKQERRFINSAIKNILNSSLNANFQKIFELPTQKYIHIYIKNYKPIGQQICQNLKTIILSSAFQIHRVSEVGSQKIYFGEMQNRLYHGYGVLISQYEIRQGFWELGSMVNGIVKNSLQFYKGNLRQNVKNGYGECFYQNGGFYQGQWEKNNMHGHGYFKHSNFQYLGDWESGLFHGKGVLKTYFSVYEGFFVKSFQSGNGKQTFANEDHYDGSFEADYPQGSGKYYWKSGEYYTGVFSKGKRQGQAVFIAPGILQYKGHYKNDRPSGEGKIYYINGDQYHGLFFKGQKNGLGDLMCKNKKIIYSGEWVNDSLVYEFKQLK